MTDPITTWVLTANGPQELVQGAGTEGPPGATGATGATGPAGADGVGDVVVVEHGTDPDVTRPASPAVYWQGSVEPNNAIDGDLWVGPGGGVGGGGGASGTYTPALTGITLGTGGTNTAKFNYDNGVLVVEGVITFGSGGSPGGSAAVGLPSGYTLAATADYRPVGFGDYLQTGVAHYIGVMMPATSTTIGLLLQNAAGTYLALALLSSTVPFTWSSGHQIMYQYTIRAVGP